MHDKFNIVCKYHKYFPALIYVYVKIPIKTQPLKENQLEKKVGLMYATENR